MVAGLGRAAVGVRALQRPVDVGPGVVGAVVDPAGRAGLVGSAARAAVEPVPDQLVVFAAAHRSQRQQQHHDQPHRRSSSDPWYRHGRGAAKNRPACRRLPPQDAPGAPRAGTGGRPRSGAWMAMSDASAWRGARHGQATLATTPLSGCSASRFFDGHTEAQLLRAAWRHGAEGRGAPRVGAALDEATRARGRGRPWLSPRRKRRAPVARDQHLSACFGEGTQPVGPLCPGVRWSPR